MLADNRGEVVGEEGLQFASCRLPWTQTLQPLAETLGYRAD